MSVLSEKWTEEAEEFCDLKSLACFFSKRSLKTLAYAVLGAFQLKFRMGMRPMLNNIDQG